MEWSDVRNQFETHRRRYDALHQIHGLYLWRAYPPYSEHMQAWRKNQIDYHKACMDLLRPAMWSITT